MFGVERRRLFGLGETEELEGGDDLARIRVFEKMYIWGVGVYLSKYAASS